MSHEASLSTPHYQLVRQHRRCGGEVLRGHGLRTRIFEDRTPSRYIAWGADYFPDARLIPSMFYLIRLSAAQREAMKDPLGVPAPAPAEAWLSTAVPHDNSQTTLTRFEYNADTWARLGDGEPRISLLTVDTPYDDVTIATMRAGLGYSRALPLNFERATDTQIDELVAALQGLLTTVANRV